jgi:hypothetical protein
MATVNFSVPAEVKRAFDQTFRGKNKSAIVARLLIQAIEDEKRQQRRAQAIEELLRLRSTAPSVSDDEAYAARQQDRS